jgi:hypothetical protein
MIVVSVNSSLFLRFLFSILITILKYVIIVTCLGIMSILVFGHTYMQYQRQFIKQHLCFLFLAKNYHKI